MTTTTVILKNNTLPLNDEIWNSLDLQVGDMVKFTPVAEGFALTKWDGQLDLFEDVTQYVSEVFEMENENG